MPRECRAVGSSQSPEPKSLWPESRSQVPAIRSIVRPVAMRLSLPANDRAPTAIVPGILRHIMPPNAVRNVAPIDTWGPRSEALAQVLARTALGDRVAFATLYRETSAHLFGVILRINPDRAQAEDLLQEVFVNVWRAAQGFDAARSQPLTWLTSIARNRAIDSLRRRKAEVDTVSVNLAGRDEEGDHDQTADIASDQAGPLQQLEQAAQAREVTHCLKQLSAEQQQCMALAFYQGLSHAEVAEHLAQPLGTVKSWVRRALMTLKQCLGRPVPKLA